MKVVIALQQYPRRQQAHAVLDRLPDDQLAAVCGLLEAMLSPVDRKLALASVDDEPVPAGERAAIQVGIESLEHNSGVPLEDVLADFRLTMDDFNRMAETGMPEEPAQ